MRGSASPSPSPLSYRYLWLKQAGNRKALNSEERLNQPVQMMASETFWRVPKNELTEKITFFPENPGGFQFFALHREGFQL
jgi:hypothetical protein